MALGSIDFFGRLRLTPEVALFEWLFRIVEQVRRFAVNETAARADPGPDVIVAGGVLRSTLG